MLLKNLFSTIARNSFFNAFGKLTLKVISFAFTIFMVRWLGDESYGQYTLIWSYVLIFAMLSDAGLGMYTIREIAQKQSRHLAIASNVMALRLVLASGTIGLIFVTVWLFGYSAQFLSEVLLASLILLLYAIQDPLDAILQAYEQFNVAMIALVAGQLVFVLSGTIFLLCGWHITGLIIASLLNVAVASGLAWYLMGEGRQDLTWQIQPSKWPCLLYTAAPFGLIKLWLSWSLKLDLIILAYYWSPNMVGWYGAAYAIISGLMVISNAINVAVYPTLSRQDHQDNIVMTQIYETVLKYLLLIALPIAGGSFMIADQAISLLFGTEFAPAAQSLAILIWVIPLAFTSEFLRYVLLALNQEKAAVYALGATVFGCTVLNLIFVPRYGFLAASAVSVLAEAFLLTLYAWHLKQQLQFIPFNQVILKPILAMLILMIIVFISAPLGLAAQIILGGFIYISLIWQLGLIKTEESMLLFNLVGSMKSGVKRKGAGIKSQIFSYLTTPPQPPTPKLVSVFIPTYNSAEFLTQAIDSVLAQTYKNYELIIIDDGSSDNTPEILAAYQNLPQIRLYRHARNVGMAANWNIGLQLCQGEFIAKLDSDDYYEPTYLETAMAFFQKNQAVGLVFSGVNLVYPDGRYEPEMRFLYSWVRERDSFLASLLRLCIIRSPSVCVRRACYEQVGGFNEQMKIHADWEMWVRLAANYPVGFINQLLANYRTNHVTNCTAQAAVDGRSMHDLRLWLDLLANQRLPYRLTANEEREFRWGIYEMEMHFAGMAAYYYQQADMEQTYTAFANEVLSRRPPQEMKRMGQVYINLHQGICAFRENQLVEARRHFWQAIRLGPEHCRSPWIWNKLLLTFVGKTKWGVMYR